MSLKVAHIADVHLRQRQYGYPQRGADFLSALLSAIRKAHEVGCHYIIVAGDLLDSTNPGAAVCIDQLDDVQGLLKELKVCMLITSGNHDKTSPHWCSRFNKFFKDEDGGMKVIDNEIYTLKNEEVAVTAYGLPFMPDNEFREALPTLPEADVLIWHAAIKEFTGYPTENAITCAELNCGKWSLVAMGDQHVHKVIVEGDTVIAYPGSTELCSTSEDLEKQMLVYDFNANGSLDVTSVAFDTRKKQIFTVKTEKELDDAISKFDPNAVIFVRYTTDITNANLKLHNAAKPTNLLRLTPITPVKGTAADVSITEELKDPVEFLRDAIPVFVKDKDRAQRITPLCASVLSQDIDYMKELEAYCETQLNKTII